jgi:hypothetical protein
VFIAAELVRFENESGDKVAALPRAAMVLANLPKFGYTGRLVIRL